MRPKRICALCPATIREKQRLCNNCQETWKDELTSNWIHGIINESEYQHNVELRDYGRVIPMELLKRNM